MMVLFAAWDEEKLFMVSPFCLLLNDMNQWSEGPLNIYYVLT